MLRPRPTANTGNVQFGLSRARTPPWIQLGLLISAEFFGDSGEGTGINLYHTEPTVQNCTCSSSINTHSCPAALEEFSFTALLALFLFAVLIVCVCYWQSNSWPTMVYELGKSDHLGPYVGPKWLSLVTSLTCRRCAVFAASPRPPEHTQNAPRARWHTARHAFR